MNESKFSIVQTVSNRVGRVQKFCDTPFGSSGGIIVNKKGGQNSLPVNRGSIYSIKEETFLAKKNQIS